MKQPEATTVGTPGTTVGTPGTTVGTPGTTTRTPATAAADRYGYRADRAFDLTDTSISEDAFFELDSPVVVADYDQRQPLSTINGSGTESQRSHLEGELEHHGGGDYDGLKPRPEIILRWKRLAIYVAISVLAISGLTVSFWIGIPVLTIREPAGNSEESEEKLRLYNTYSGAIMGILETLVGLGFANFFPAFTVYVHNLKWWPGDDPIEKTSKVKKVLLLLFFPVVMIAIGNSFSALQAGASTIGSLTVMNSTSLGVYSTNYTRPSVAAFKGNIVNHETTILKTAMQRRSTPFQYIRSRCSTDLVEQTDETKSALKRVSDIDSTSTVFGFPVKEWGRELYPEGSPTFSSDVLDLNTSFELMFQGTALLERSVGSLTTTAGRCHYDIDGTLTCVKRNQTAMNQLYGYFNGTKEKTDEALATELKRVLQNSFYGDLNESTFSVRYSSFPVSKQVKYEGMTFSIYFKKDFEYGLTGDTEIVPEGCSGDACQYRYGFLDKDAFCGGDNCIFPDWNAQFIPRRQASMMQYKKNCQQASATFDENLQTHVPGGCQNETDSAFLYGFGTRIFADTFGSMEDDTPYILNPRRFLMFTVGKLSWTFQDLTESFADAKCIDTSSSEPCQGLKHDLAESGRHILVGKDHLPAKFATSDFRQPISLFELMMPIIQSPRIAGGQAILEQLRNTSFFASNAVTTVTLAVNMCSFRADAFMKHIATNVYQVYNPFQPMYTSAMLYLFQSASVTKVRQEGTTRKPRFVGDRALSKVQVRNTEVGVYTVWIGCIILTILAVVTLVFPNERARLEPMMGKNARAERFVAVQTEEIYPNLVYMKRFRIGKTGEALKLSEFSVESVGLHHRMEEDEQVFL